MKSFGRLGSFIIFSLTGWYLMTPPASKLPKIGWTVGPDEPLTEWENVASYDNAVDCEDARASLYQKGMALIRATKNAFSDEAALGQQYAAAQCIATDDPRFNGK
jgi:hypothetical protein